MKEFRSWLSLGLAALVVALGFLWWRSDQRHNETVQAYADSLVESELVVDSLTGRVSALDSIAAADSARWAARFDSLDGVIRRSQIEAVEARSVALAAGDSLEATLTMLADRIPEAAPAVEVGLEQLEELERQYKREATAQRSTIDALRGQLAVRDSAVAQLRAQRDSRDVLIEQLRERNRLQSRMVVELRDELNVNLLEKLYRDPLVKAAAAIAGFVAGAAASS